MNLAAIHSVYFVGIGGIGMSALARYFAAVGKRVAGYDRTRTPLTQALEDEGIEVTHQDDVAHLPAWFLHTPLDRALVVYTPAIPATNATLAFLKNYGCPVMKRAEVLSEVTATGRTIAVAGTHGKTSTSSLIAHILHSAGLPANAFLGGIATNYGTNVMLHPQAAWSVAEADEYDRSFLKLNPYIAVITSAEADHLDIYGTEAALVASFGEFAAKVHPEGLTVIRHGIPVQPCGKWVSYGIQQPEATYSAQQVRVSDGLFHFDVVKEGALLGHIASPFPGRHNAENCLAAIAVALHLGIGFDAVAAAVASFLGVKRRFEYHIRREGRVYIDDYAHHPTELTNCIGAAKELYPESRITGVFQPHLYSRTRDFADAFARSLEALHDVLLMEIYPARELPLEGVNSAMLLHKIHHTNKRLVQRHEVVEEILRLDPEVLLTLGAGDIDQLVEPIKNALNDQDA